MWEHCCNFDLKLPLKGSLQLKSSNQSVALVTVITSSPSPTTAVSVLQSPVLKEERKEKEREEKERYYGYGRKMFLVPVLQ